MINLSTGYTIVLTPKKAIAVDSFDQTIYALSKFDQWLFPKCTMLCVLHIKKALLGANRNLVNGTRLSYLLSDNTIETIGLETASIDVNYIHKTRYYFQLKVFAIYKCLKEEHASSQDEKAFHLS